VSHKRAVPSQEPETNILEFDPLIETLRKQYNTKLKESVEQENICVGKYNLALTLMMD
jgi:hypothetical protein